MSNISHFHEDTTFSSFILEPVDLQAASADAVTNTPLSLLTATPFVASLHLTATPVRRD